MVQKLFAFHDDNAPILTQPDLLRHNLKSPKMKSRIYISVPVPEPQYYLSHSSLFRTECTADIDYYPLYGTICIHETTYNISITSFLDTLNYYMC